MKINATADLKATRPISIINIETVFQLGETDLSEWNFDEEVLYASLFNQDAESDPAIESASKKVQLKSAWAA
jgi:hypothetical protein